MNGEPKQTVVVDRRSGASGPLQTFVLSHDSRILTRRHPTENRGLLRDRERRGAPAQKKIEGGRSDGGIETGWSVASHERSEIHFA
jgi:hypothetical protein